MGIKISGMTEDTSIGGSEIVPVVDSGVSKRTTISGIKNFVVDQIESITAGTAVTGADGVYVLQGGALKPVDIDLVAQHAIDTIWGKANDASPAGTDKVAIKDAGTTENTVTLANLAEYVRGAIEASVLDVSDLTAAGTLTTADMLLVTQGTSGRKVTLDVLNTKLLEGFNAYLTALGAVTANADSDVLYVIQGGVEKKATLSQVKTYLGISEGVTAPGTITLDYIPQWSGAGKALKEGLAVTSTVAASGETTGAIPTDTAVRAAIESSSSGIGNEEKTALVDNDVSFLSDSQGLLAYKKFLLSTLFAYIADKIEAIAAATSVGASDSIYILQGGVLKPATMADFISYLEGSFTGLELGETELTAYRGDRGKIAYDHSQTAHAPADAQKNSDITKAEIEAVLTGEISSHTHASSGGVMSFGGVVDSVATTYTLGATQIASGRYFAMDNGSAITVTLNSDLYGVLELGDVIEIEQRGAGAVTLNDSTPIDLLPSGNISTTAQHQSIRVVYVKYDEGASKMIFRVTLI